MATAPVELSVTIKDGLGVSGTILLYGKTDTSHTIADLEGDAVTMLGDINGLTDGAISRASIRVVLDTSSYGSPGSDSEVEKGALFNMSQGGTAFKQGYWVPAVKDSLIVNGKVNLADAAVTAFLATLTASGAVIDYTGKFGNLLVALTDALISFRKHRRAENRRSVETP